MARIMLPLALATLAEPFVLHVILIFITINVVINVGISVGIDIHITAVPVGMPPCIPPRSAQSKACSKCHGSIRIRGCIGKEREKRRWWRESRPPPGSINHRRVVTRDIDHFWLCGLNDNCLLFHNDLLLWVIF